MDTKEEKEEEMGKKVKHSEVKAEEAKTEEAKTISDAEKNDFQIAALQAKLESAEAELSSLKDQMLRDRAEIENFRKRLARDKDEAVKYANSNLIKDLLQPLDDFNRALDAAESTKDFAKVHDGVLMVSSQLYGLLERNWGLEKIEAVGKEFDPEEHEACMVVEDPSLSVETVLEDFSTGYKLHGRILRPSKVKVGKPTV
ncbi:molecular chaperone GrpE (heat shock protein) [Sphaerochaeta pleomorpha str. Grapes]|uniref:Protein GrpE n=1 Tax=Sphaerochaeta pleomorpha (strain ATCC BAA-1885 / DSM 22778 / Grapes) TaxID=158190 RepID=G8QRM3_SPHPG|nr:nucleotide exchange factor GrpE [Sphaerochaeta pleomorpha]AEV29945.1 molecular chaperone GrpE (heat shock protein) [Sphaerochaeta pleomorpha str. Grapes]